MKTDIPDLEQGSGSSGSGSGSGSGSSRGGGSAINSGLDIVFRSEAVVRLVDNFVVKLCRAWWYLVVCVVKLCRHYLTSGS